MSLPPSRPWRLSRVPALLLVALALGLAACGTSDPSTSGTAETPGPRGTPAPGGSGSPGQSAAVPSGTGTYEGLPVGFTSEGFPYIGRADAPVTIEEFSDYLCPFCGRHASQTLPSLKRGDIATGRVRYVFRDLPLASLHPTASEAHVAARCVGHQGPALYWAMHDELFATQEQWRNLPSPTEFLATSAQKVGADMTAYAACLAAGVEKTWVDEAVADARDFGFNGTPTFRFIPAADVAPPSGEEPPDGAYTLVGAQPLAVFTEWIGALAAAKAPPDYRDPTASAPPATPAPLPRWASAEGLAPDPARPGFTKNGDPYKGSPQAKVTVVEFSNFQCSHCRDHAVDAQPTIDKELVETGQVRWVFKNLPLQSLAQSTDAAVAAVCAGFQGRFWEMHDLLFERQEAWSVATDLPVLEGIAAEADLDASEFADCFESRKALERVMNDMYDARGVATETPTFVVLSGGRGSVFTGKRPADQWVTLLEAQLDDAAASPASVETQAPSPQP